MDKPKNDSLYWEELNSRKNYVQGFGPAMRASDKPAIAGAYIFALYAKLSKFWNHRRLKHVRAIYFLKHEGLYKAYRQTLKELGLKSTLSTVQNFYYFWVLKKHYKFNEPVTALEIGAGGGLFMLLATRYLNVKKYYIVDLPQMLEVSKKTASLYPQLKDKIIFLKPDEINKAESVNAVFNFMSFSEMEPVEVKKYFEFIYRQKGAVFYNINYWRVNKNRDGNMTEMNPILFPYGNDEILYWRANKLHYVQKGSFGVVPSLSLIRLSKIK